MAPIKFEENIKEKLEQRSLQPSANAWQSLEQKLNAGSKKRNNNKFWWFGIAASFMLMLFIVQQIITPNSNNVNTPIIVESEDKTLDNQQLTPLVENSELSSEEIFEDSKRTPKVNSMSSPKKENKRIVIDQPIVENRIVVNNEKPSKMSNQKTVLNNDNAFSEAKVNASLSTSIAQVTPSETLPSKTTDSEIDALLNAALTETQLNDYNAISKTSVDASALLEDVETEMPPSLRGQIFKVIEKNFKTAKSAVVTRNE